MHKYALTLSLKLNNYKITKQWSHKCEKGNW